MNEQKQEIHYVEMKHYGFGTEVMKQIKVCSRCKAKAEATQIFCKECGTKLPSDTLYEIYKRKNRVCKSCDAIITQEMRYCPKCGRKLDEKGEEK